MTSNFSYGSKKVLIRKKYASLEDLFTCLIGIHIGGCPK